MGDAGVPCGIPVPTSFGSSFSPSTEMAVFRSVRNASVHASISFGNCIFCRVLINLCLETLSKAPFTSIKRAEVTSPFTLALSTFVARHSAASTADL